ncbi:hypothetical protein [Chitinophaga sp.]|uniref:hypothetical protein n=1 Tax=Chitinophaga sp. TaxID=1869181 RepID=UPI0031DA418F
MLNEFICPSFPHPLILPENKRMAIVKDNILLQLVNGSLGDIITIYVRNGQIIMAKKRGPSTEPPTSKQLLARLRMKIAVALAKEMIKDPEVKAAFAAQAGPGQNAFNMAVKHAFNTPIVLEAALPPAPKNIPPQQRDGIKNSLLPKDSLIPKNSFIPEKLLHELTQFREIG